MRTAARIEQEGWPPRPDEGGEASDRRLPPPPSPMQRRVAALRLALPALSYYEMPHLIVHLVDVCAAPPAAADAGMLQFLVAYQH